MMNVDLEIFSRGCTCNEDLASDKSFIGRYFHSMVNKFFKILPMKENEESTLQSYLESLKIEIIGAGSLVRRIDDESLTMTLASIIQYFIDNQEISVREVKREVFRAISICNKLEAKCNGGSVGK